jgi:hypothetical protein
VDVSTAILELRGYFIDVIPHENAALILTPTPIFIPPAKSELVKAKPRNDRIIQAKKEITQCIKVSFLFCFAL